MLVAEVNLLECTIASQRLTLIFKVLMRIVCDIHDQIKYDITKENETQAHYIPL